MLIPRVAAVGCALAQLVSVVGGESPVLVNPVNATVGEAAPQRLDSPFSEGELFPDLALPSLSTGAPTRLSDFRGRKVMLHVFASW